MRKRVLLAIILIAGASSISYLCAKRSLGRQPSDGATVDVPLIDCPREINLGQRELGDEVIAHLTISNLGTAELVIEQVRTNCSCTGLERYIAGELHAVESLRVQPGESAEVSVRVAVRGRAGFPLTNIVEFQTNDPRRPDVRISLVVPRVTAGVTTFPSSVVFGTIRVGCIARHLVDIRDESPDPRRIVGASATMPDVVKGARFAAGSGFQSFAGW